MVSKAQVFLTSGAAPNHERVPMFVLRCPNSYIGVMRSLFFLTLCVVGVAFAQEAAIPEFNFPDSTYRVGQVIYIGNEVTKYQVIEQEMTLRPGTLITHAGVTFDINRIYSLRLFTKVEINVVPDSADLATVTVTVNERWYIYPFPVLGIKDRDFSKIYYGLGLSHTNLGGNNTQLYGAFALGFDPFVSLNYSNPQLDFEHKIFLSLRAYYTDVMNKSVVSRAGTSNFREFRSGAEVTLGHRYSLYSLVALKGEYLNLAVSDNAAGRTLSPGGRDEFFSLHMSYSYDTRDLKEYPSYGSYYSVGVSKYGLFEQTIDYQRVGIDLRRFIPTWNNVVLAGRVFANLAGGGRIPNYGHAFFGYGERIRGYFNTVLEAEQIAGGTAELHFPLIKPQYVRYDFIPLEQFRDVRYAVNAALFADAGETWYRTQPFTVGNVYAGYGAGLHILLMYSVVARVEFAVPYGKSVKNGEIILDVGAAL